MKKYSKKIALILALATVLGLAIPSLAAGSSTKIDAKYALADISVLVPTVGSATLNPYSLPVKIYADDGTTLVDELRTSGQIATRPLVGVNLSSMDLKVGATVTAKTSGNFKFLTEAPAADNTKNVGLVYLEVQAVNDLGYNVSHDTTTVANEVCGGFDKTKVMNALNGWTKTTYSESNNSQLLIGKKAVSKSGMVAKINHGTINQTTKEVTGPAAGGYFMARLGGDIVKSPKKAWTTKDGFSVEIVWDFEPA